MITATGADYGLALCDKAQLASWPTPNAEKTTKNSKDPKKMKENGCQTALADAAWMASWATPSQRDFKSNEGSDEFHAARSEQSRGKPLSEQAHQLTASGETPSGFHAVTEKRGQLNPALSRWLMGLPPEWCVAAIKAHRLMKSTRKTRLKQG